MKRLRFLWSLSSAGANYKGAKARGQQDGIPDLEAHIEHCRVAERCGIESLLTAIGFHRADPVALAAALGMATERVKFLVACRTGIVSPTLFAQQINTLSALTQGRVAVNMVAGHTPEELGYYGDFLPHDRRYERLDEFLTICRRLWEGEAPFDFDGEHYRIKNGQLRIPFVSPRASTPEIYLGGASAKAVELAAKHASCLLTLPTTDQELRHRIRPLLQSRAEAGLLVSLIARPSREEALGKAASILEDVGEKARRTHEEFKKGSDSVAFKSTLSIADREDSQWLSETLWTGAVPYLGAPAIALVGGYRQVAEALIRYRRMGISQFLFMGWPDTEEMGHFARGVLPRVRELEERVCA